MTEKKYTILVTGALGHIGSRLIRSFSADEVGEIRLLDNLCTQRYPSLFDLPADIKYRFYEEDVRTCDLGKRLEGVDTVIHLAALTDAATSHQRPEEVESVNLDGLKRVADACLAANVRLLFPSTTSVYGSQALRVDESCTELKPQSPYAESKLAAEAYLSSLKNKGLRFVICRFGTIFGPSMGMRFHTAVNKFIWQAVLGQPLTVWKTAWQQKRPYLDLTDCVASIQYILRNDMFDCELYNILTSNYTVEDIVNAIKQFAPGLEVTFVDSPIMNQLSYDVDCSKFTGKGFIFRGDLHQGISDTMGLLSAVKVK